MNSTPVDRDLIKKRISKMGIERLDTASIREIRKLVGELEQETGLSFIKMEMGIPGLPAPHIGIEAEKAALDKGVAAMYPPIDGVPVLKHEISRFSKNFMNIDAPPEFCFSTVGSIQACFAFFMVASRRDKQKDTILFIDPGFPVHKQMVKMIGANIEAFDVYHYRGDALRERLNSYLQKGNISAVVYSNPNNPTWIAFTEKELAIIGELCTKYDVIAAEDLAYFAMDFRADLSVPGKPPFQPSVANYTDNYVQFISSSKVFSYAGQRVGMMILSKQVFDKECADLKRFFATQRFGHSLVFGALYGSTAGASHSAQYGLAAMLKKVNDGEYNFIETVKEYGKRARVMKRLFTENGFTIVYDKDEDQPIGDGFYFTIAYPGMTGEELTFELLAHGISAINLITTGSERTEGMRACVSFVLPDQFPDLEKRLTAFRTNHPK